MKVSKGKKIVAPIAVDVGASHFGVFRACYPRGTRFSDIAIKKGEVLEFDNTRYTFLMTARTAARHQRRSFDRRRLAKRLVFLILKEYFHFPASEHTQALGYLMNRRGFSFLQGEYDKAALADFPEELWIELPQTLQDKIGGRTELKTYFREIADDEGMIRELREAILGTMDAAKSAAKKTRGQRAWAKASRNPDPDKFTVALTDSSHKNYLKAHAENLAYAVFSMADEFASGARHRKIYFEEMLQEIEAAAVSKVGYLRRLGEALAIHPRLDETSLFQLLAHVSNLELKPLRRYFNDPCHKGGDVWQPERLVAIVSRWFMKQWRVNAEKDGQEKVAAYHDLRKQWEDWENKDDIVAFWLKTDPLLTIPPYQSHTNRRPPSCYSLVLNPKYMEKAYPSWRQWLRLLDTGESPDVTAGARHRKGERCGEPLASEEEICLRRLHFILDRARQDDPFRLNLIWSQYHRQQKYPAGTEEHAKALDEKNRHIQASLLPESLKDDLAFDRQGSFGHFLNKYYQARRRAWEGRYFLHPALGKESGKFWQRKWDDDHSILTLCPHRPRQKKHQVLADVAAIIGLTPKEFRELSGCDTPDDVETFLLTIKGLKTAGKEAAGLQKTWRGRLKLELQRAQVTRQQNKKLSKEHKHLLACADKVQNAARKLAAQLWPKAVDAQLDARAAAFSSLFSLAQIYNLVFKDRSGFSATCPVCNADNAGRMAKSASGNALASRLPALSLRLIDGAVMRLMEHAAHEIARRHWELISPELESGNEVVVPLVMEQNRFEFEPALRTLKNKPKKKEKVPKDTFDHGSKIERVKNASAGINPYPVGAESLGEGGEIDHIIPRSSSYGTMNDEANLIYVGREANRAKGDKIYHLSDLRPGYKSKIFGTTDDAKITRWIRRTLIGDMAAEANRFVFGPYQNFSNLNKDQQIAFRHALFLTEDDPIRQMVITAIQNRNRTFVNGTQRFLAQKIADRLHQKARQIGVQGRLSFDYFEYPPDPDHPKGIQSLRQELDLEKPDIQSAYSHHIDAHMAFLVACDDHRNDGSMGVAMDEHESVWPSLSWGDVTPYETTKIQPAEVLVIRPSRIGTNEKINREIEAGRQLSRHFEKIVRRHLFSQNAIGQQFKPVFRYKGKWYAGWPMRRANEQGWDVERFAKPVTKKKDTGLLEQMTAAGRYFRKTVDEDEPEMKLFVPQKVEVERDAFACFGPDQKSLPKNLQQMRPSLLWIARNCRVWVRRKSVLDAPKIIKKGKSRQHPSIQAWVRFHEGWRRRLGEEPPVRKGQYNISTECQTMWREYLRNFFSRGENSKAPHGKKGKDYSLTTVEDPSGTVLLVRRRGCFQCVPVNNKEIAVELIPFLIRSSRNVAWFDKKAEKALKVDLQPLELGDALERRLAPEKFFSSAFVKKARTALDNIIVTWRENTVSVTGFPLDLFQALLVNVTDLSAHKSLIMLTDKKIKEGEGNEGCIRKVLLDSWLKVSPRDGRIKYSLQETSVSMSIPYKKNQHNKLKVCIAT